MRLFVAIDLPSEIKDYLYDLQSKLKDNKVAKINWVSKKNLHITLKFLGGVPDDNVSNLISDLKKIKLNSSNVSLNQVGFYPNINRINVIWVGLHPEDNIINLQKFVDSQTLNCGDIKLGAHITLGRVKQLKNKKKFLDKINLNIEKISFKVDSFYLFKSILNKNGPTYEVVEKFYLI